MFVLPFLLGFHVFAQVAPQFYQIQIPATSQSCENEVQQLAGKFQQLAGFSPLSAKCGASTPFKAEGKDYALYSLELSYKIPQNLSHFKINSSYYGNSSLSEQRNNNIVGLYATFESCLKDLKKRTQEFEVNANAPVFSSTCERARSTYEISYVVRIDTIGELTTHLYSTSSLSEQLEHTPLQKAVQKMIRFGGGKIIELNKGYIYYYAQEPVEPQYQSFGYVTAAECAEQLPDLEKIFSGFNLAEISLGCAPSRALKDPKQDLVAVWNHFAMFNESTIAKAYVSYSECKRDKNRVMETYRKYGSHVYAAICSTDEYSFNKANYLMKVYHDL
ncbi:MAG: hypothetical protein ACXVB1_07755 [Pseudobdellovibrionaceae bacterium]